MEQTLTSIMRNSHFVQLSAFIHVPFVEFMWSARHPTVPARSMINEMSRIVFKGSNGGNYGLTQEQKVRFLGIWADFASQVVMEDLRLSYSEEDMEWLVQVLDSEDARVTLSLLFAAASCKETYLTPAEVAEQLGENEVVWRRKAARYEVPGTIHKSRGWLIPLSGLRSIGILMDYRPSEDQEYESESDDIHDEVEQ